jgi:hypothetical protein
MHPISERYFAYKAFHEAVKRGEIEYLPCEICGEKAQAHHDDYSKPLDVRFLCRTHHAQIPRCRKINSTYKHVAGSVPVGLLT